MTGVFDVRDKTNLLPRVGTVFVFQVVVVVVLVVLVRVVVIVVMVVVRMVVLVVVLTWEIVDVRPRGRACEIIFVGGDCKRACKHAWVEINPASTFQRDCIQPTSLFQTHSDVLESNHCGIRVCLAVCPDCPTSSRLTARSLE